MFRNMQTIVRLFLLLVITTLVTGYKLAHNDPGNTLDDSDNDPGFKKFKLGKKYGYGSGHAHDSAYDLDVPFYGENDPGTA